MRLSNSKQQKGNGEAERKREKEGAEEGKERRMVAGQSHLPVLSEQRREEAIQRRERERERGKRGDWRVASESRCLCILAMVITALSMA